ncbi:MAG TPA: hypothetical protein VHS59_06945 [Bacillota bacterium]|nr:hypothetical protein [Bacillota bacterium]
MGNNQNEIVQARGELLVVILNLLGDTLNALGGLVELQSSRDSGNAEKVEVLGDWIVVAADVIELWLLLQENQGQLLALSNQGNVHDIS